MGFSAALRRSENEGLARRGVNVSVSLPESMSFSFSVFIFEQNSVSLVA